jgi:hypothetical protein
VGGLIERLEQGKLSCSNASLDVEVMLQNRVRAEVFIVVLDIAECNFPFA